jgi:hypothetical protein
MNYLKLAFLFLFLNPLMGTADDFDLLVTTYNNKIALINVSESGFEENSFTISLNITWVNKNLKPIKDENSVLAINKQALQVFPEDALNTLGNIKVSEFSNKQINLKFYANPRFDGGKVKIDLQLVYSENVQKANAGHWKKVLYAQPNILQISYEVDGSKIVDVFPPEVKMTYPVAKTEGENDLAVISDRKTDVYITAQDKSGVKQIKVNGVRAQSKFTGEYFTTVTLFTGQNTLKIEAEDNVGNISTTTFDVISTYQYDIEMNGGNYYALLIAESEYLAPGIPNLGNPVKDAILFKDILASQYTFNEENLFLLANPTRTEILQKLEQLTNDLNENDNLIIFYAGHGYWDTNKEIGYWLPSDAESNSNSNWLRNSTVKDYIGAIKTKHTLLITDACFSGSIFQTRGFKGEQVVAYQKIYNLNSRKGMTSGTLKEVPDESVFLHTLNKRLEQNEDKYFLASNLFSSLRDAVLNNSPNVPQFGTIQGAGDEGGEFIFIRKDTD